MQEAHRSFTRLHHVAEGLQRWDLAFLEPRDDGDQAHGGFLLKAR